MLVTPFVQIARPLFRYRDGRQPCSIKQHRSGCGQECNSIKNRSNGDLQSDVAGAAPASPAPFLPAQLLTAAISRSQSIEEIARTCSTHWDALNHIHISAALSAAVKLPASQYRRPAAAALLDSLTRRFTDTLPTSSATAREVATVLWSLAKLGRPAPCVLLTCLAQTAAAAAVAAGPQHQAHPRQDRRGAPRPHADLFVDASPQALSNILWALATWRTTGPDPRLLRRLLEVCAGALPTFQPQDTANVLYALARLCAAPNPIRHSHRHRPKGAVTAALALDELPEGLLEGLLATATAQATQMTPQGLATCAWACHRLRRPHAAFLRAASTAFAAAAAKAASPTDVALMTASLAALRFRCPALLRAVAKRCCRDLLGSEIGGDNGSGGGGGDDWQLESKVGRNESGPGPSSSSLSATFSSSSSPMAVAAAAARCWTVHCRQRLLWAFATFKFRHPAAVRALLLLPPPQGARLATGGGNNDGNCVRAAAADGDDSGSSGPIESRNWGWEPGEMSDSNPVAGGGDGGGGEDVRGGGGGVAVSASNLIWCAARLDYGREAGPEQRAVLAAAEALWGDRSSAALSHAAVAAWGLERLGLRGLTTGQSQGPCAGPEPGQCVTERLLRLACERLQKALDRSAACPAPGSSAAAAASAATAPRPASPSFSAPGAVAATYPAVGHRSSENLDPNLDPNLVPEPDLDLSPGELDAAVMVLWCLGRRGPAGRVERREEGDEEGDEDPDSAESTDTDSDTDAALAAAAAESRLLESFSAAAPRLLPRLSTRQLPRLLCSYVQLERNDPRVMGRAAELLMRGEEEGEEEDAVVGGDGGGGGGGSGAAAVARQQQCPEEERGEGEEGGEEVEEEGEHEGEGAEDDWLLDGWYSPDVLRGEAAAAGHGIGGGGGRAGSNKGSGGGAAHTSSGRGRVASSGGIGSRLGRMPRNGLAMTLWALASAGTASPQLMQRAADHVVRLFPPVQPPNRDPAPAPTPEPPMLMQQQQKAPPGAAAAAVGGKPSRWAALILWAFAASDCYNAVLYDNLLSYVIRRERCLGPGRVAMVLWGCAVARHYHREALEALCGALLEGGIRALPPASFAQANWAVAHLAGGLCLSWRGPAASHMASLAPSLTPHQAAVMLWALAVQQLVLSGPGYRDSFAAAVELMMGRLAAAGRGRAVHGLPDLYLPDLSDLNLDVLDLPDPGGGRAGPGGDSDPDRDSGSELRRWAGHDRGSCNGDREEGEDEEGYVTPSSSPSSHPFALELDVALIAAEAVALLLASPHAAVRASVQRHLTASDPPPQPPGPQPSAPTATPAAAHQREDDEAAPGGAAAAVAPSAVRSGGQQDPAPAPAAVVARFPGVEGEDTAAAATATLGSALAHQLFAAWRRALRRRHPQLLAVAVAARQLGYSPRPLLTDDHFPLASGCAMELPDAVPGPAVVLLAERSDFAVNVVGQPLGPLFTTVQLLKERGWRVAVLLAPQFAAMRPRARQSRHLRQLLTAAGVRPPTAATAAQGYGRQRDGQQQHRPREHVERGQGQR